jgi:calmodulin
MAAMDEVDGMLTAIASLLKRKRIRSSDLFRTINTSGDGQATSEELRAALVDLGLKPKPDLFASLVARLDPDRSGKVGIKELEKALRQADRKQPEGQDNASASRKPASRRDRRVPSKSTLMKKDKEEFRQIFCLFKQLCRAGGSDEPELVDWDESGNIAVDELEQLLETVGLKLTNSELDVILRDLDKNNDGSVDFEEFCSSMTEQIQVDYTQEEISRAFASFQRNSPEGLIKVTDLRECLKTHMYHDMIDAEVDELIFQYKDSFTKLPGSDEEYFNFQDYINLMAPIGGAGSD